MTYRIKSVAALTGISAATLRAWERRYDLVSPERTAGGYRTYSDDDVERLRRVKTLVDRGFKVSEAIALAQRGDTQASAKLPDAGELRAGLQRAFLALDHAAAASLLPALGRLSFRERMERVFFPILHDVGERWARGEATVVQEHFASAWVRERLAGMLEATVPGAGGRPEAVCAGLPGERHELGLMAAAVHLALRGWRVTYLGADVPFDALEPTLREHRPALVCTSLMFGIPEAECLEIAARLREIAPPETEVLIGGPGVPASLIGSPEPGVRLTRVFPERLEAAA
jgi:DNA-binding transcriptional MerR regulator